MKICVLLPDYSTTDVDYQHYDPPRDLATLLPADQVDTVFLNKLTVYKQLKVLGKQGYDIFVNLCEAYLEWEVPGIDTIYYLELLNLPFTGPSSRLYDPSKEIMKLVAFYEGVQTPAYGLLSKGENVSACIEALSFPLFVKPSKAGDSLGIDAGSKVDNRAALDHQLEKIFKDFDEVLIENYISGREFTVLVAADQDGQSVHAYHPVEFIFQLTILSKPMRLKHRNYMWMRISR